MSVSPELETHLREGVTTLRDGVQFGFTDHDQDVLFDGMIFKADTGMTARALSQSTGLSIDNTEALGVLNDDAITEKDIRAGRFDSAQVEAWLVNWTAPDQRYLQFRGTVGELSREAGGFRAELSGLTEALNQAQGRAYQTPCSAILGDGTCRFDLGQTGYAVELATRENEAETTFHFEGLDLYPSHWFERGRFIVLSGEAKDLSGIIKNDRKGDAGGR